MSKVYVIQKQLKLDDAGELTPKYDLASAKHYGELIYLLSPTAGPFSTESVVRELQHKLADYTTDDYLLLVGNPCLIGWATAIAAHRTGGEVSFLQWHGKSRSYMPIKSALWDSQTACLSSR